ncbi:hypothetical protein ACN42_g7594 [Penicillium freii]|uniref:Secreted protein n=1 Tax=Penicillium freii TaxID=48697 RepID=A0A117NMP3_PENFR|nr:hypothetical protein ACN42_g7594 [Penicillium freii]
MMLICSFIVTYLQRFAFPLFEVSSLDMCHVYIYRSLDYLSITLRYGGPLGIVCNSPVLRQVITTCLLRPLGLIFKYHLFNHFD